MLERFIAILDLQGVEEVDENAIMAMNEDHPEQLVIKLSYLALQCQIVVMDSKITREERRRAVRRVFLDYVLEPPNADIESLADYVNEIAAMDHDSALTPSITSIEEALRQAPRREWQEKWFPGNDAPSSDADQWSVIVSSPRYEDEGWAELRRHQLAWPEVYFELYGPYDLEGPFYSVVAGRDMPLERAEALLASIKAKGMAEDAFRWKASNGTEQVPQARNASAPKVRPFKPTPPRPVLNGPEGSSLSQ
ncbi:MAG: hypothetical protein ACR2QF_04990 [Geminicoccaceae bacterium]